MAGRNKQAHGQYPASIDANHGGMSRLIAIIVAIFAFAAIAGAATAHAHRYVSTPIVVLNLVDSSNQSIPVMVSVQRGEIDLGSGITMPCGPHHGIPVSISPLPVCPTDARAWPGLDSMAPRGQGSPLLRPPIET
jgi:hypothetical protein